MSLTSTMKIRSGVDARPWRGPTTILAERTVRPPTWGWLALLGERRSRQERDEQVATQSLAGVRARIDAMAISDYEVRGSSRPNTEPTLDHERTTSRVRSVLFSPFSNHGFLTPGSQRVVERRRDREGADQRTRQRARKTVRGRQDHVHLIAGAHGSRPLPPNAGRVGTEQRLRRRGARDHQKADIRARMLGRDIYRNRDNRFADAQLATRLASRPEAVFNDDLAASGLQRRRPKVANSRREVATSAPRRPVGSLRVARSSGVVFVDTSAARESGVNPRDRNSSTERIPAPTKATDPDGRLDAVLAIAKQATEAADRAAKAANAARSTMSRDSDIAQLSRSVERSLLLQLERRGVAVWRKSL